MRRPNCASFSAPPRTCRIRLSTFAAFSGYWASQPLLEDRLHLVGQAQQHVAGVARARFRGGGEDVLQFVVVEAGDHRRGQHAAGNAGGAQAADRLEAAARSRGAGLQAALQFVVERRHADEHVHQVVPGQVLQQVQVPLHQRRLGDDVDGVAELGEHFQDLRA